MKKRFWISAILGVAAIALAACGGATQGSSNSSTSSGDNSSEESSSSAVVIDCEHSMMHMPAKEATCSSSGNLEGWLCTKCKNYFFDEAGQMLTTREELLIKVPHDVVYHDERAATCSDKGNIAYYSCLDCNGLFQDEKGMKKLSEEEIFTEPTYEHIYTYQQVVYGKGWTAGTAEHWYCTGCDGYYLDEAGETKVTQAEVTLAAPFSIPDFLVEIPEGKTPVVVQFSDTQIVDGSQNRPNGSGKDPVFNAPDKMEERCFQYLREVINAVKPDFIMITGDLIFGETDDNGTSLLALINFMESFKTPWAPVFGNHDNETKKGVDWQCAQLEAATCCCFEQKELSGNGNYSVGLAQGGEVIRTFYMMDTNGCDTASAESMANGHTYATVGLKIDQVEWFTEQITELKKSEPNVKISFAYHIQPTVFEKAFEKYGGSTLADGKASNIDVHPSKADGDYGCIATKIKGAWDGGHSIFKKMKDLGMDSVFVGHEHFNNGSVMYDGVRFQYGLKSGEYDRFPQINLATGEITGSYKLLNNHKALIGGVVIPLTADGSIKDPYNYYCGFENGKIDWSKYKK